jgi:uncharacterized membrane protein YdjX (TVP38/TMEM64 family)
LTLSKSRCLMIVGWLALVAGALYVYFYHPAVIGSTIQRAASVSTFWAYTLYLILGCMRGFTLIPTTYLLLLGIVFLPPMPLFVLTMIGTVVSSAAIYYFAASFRLRDYFERKNKKQIAAIESGLQQYELPVIIGWSFFPILPTDVVCYVSGMMKVNITKVLLGIFIGEGICSAMYIFFGQSLFRFLGIGA